MKIKRVKGKDFEGDLISIVETKNAESFTLSRFALLLNSLALNEQKKALAKNWKDHTYNLWFKRICERVIEDGIMGIDLLDKKNEHLLEEYNKRWKLPTSLIQTKIDDFENGST